MRRRRMLAWYAEHPRAFEEDVARHDVVELDRYLAAQERREPADDEQARAEKWLTPVDPSDFAC